MINDIPLIRHVKFPAKPPALPIRQADDPGSPEFVENAQLVHQHERGLHLKGITQNGTETDISIMMVAPGILRVHLVDGIDNPDRVMLARDLTEQNVIVTIKESEQLFTLNSESISVRVDLNPFKITFYGPDDQMLLEQNYTATDVTGRSTGLPFGFSQVGGQRIAYHDTFTAEPDEHFYGFGEKFTSFDKRGQRLEMWQYDAFGAHSERAYKNVPFFLSTRGYGLFVDSVTQINFDMANSCHATFSVIVPDSALDYYVIAGPEPKRIIQRYAQLVGSPVVPPKWSFGLWMSSGFLSDTAEDVVKRAHLIREHQIPCDVLHIDPYWMKFGAWSDLQWDLEAFPDPEGMVNQLHELGFRLCLWINPYIGIQSPLFNEFVERGFFLKTQLGESYVVDLWSGDHPPVAILDLTNPETAGWFREALRSVLNIGVDVFKTDFGEGIPHDAQAFNGMTGAVLHNLYPLLYNDLVSELTAEETGRAGLVWARSSYAGGQRHAAQWSGDPSCTYPDMASTLRGGLSIAMCGHAFWSHDIGGFKGQPTPDLYARWAQFGAFTPMARAHGTSTRLPWEYGDQAGTIFKEYIELRYRLLPYLYSFAVEAARQGLPIIRPMVLEFPDDPSTYALELQYMFGTEILVAPIYNQTGKRRVYLPAGIWIDYWSQEIIRGPRNIFVEEPLERLPLYIRGNALIPTCEPNDHISEEPFDLVIFEAYLLDQGKFDLHDADGDTVIEAAIVDGHLKIKFKGSKTRFKLRLIPLSPTPLVNSVSINGKQLEEDLSGSEALEKPNTWLRTSDGFTLIWFEAG